jgi:hypothetical protein
MGTTRDTFVYECQDKDGFLWGSNAGEPAFQNVWQDAATENKIYPIYDKFPTFIIGRKHTYLEWAAPHDVFDRMRGYLSFYTSGYRSRGHVEQVNLRLYVIDSWAKKNDNDDPAAHYDWGISVFTVSGHVPGYPGNAQQRPYVPGDPGSEAYGFGDNIGYYDDGIEDYIVLYSSWGQWGSPADDAAGILQYHCGSGVYSEMVESDEGEKFLDAGGDPYRVRARWVEIPIKDTLINDLGETHLRLVNMPEANNELPAIGSFQHQETMTCYSSYGLLPPELAITYVDWIETKVGGEGPINELRLADLSLERHLQHGFDFDSTLSGVDILDAFPDDTTILNNKRTVSLEHVSSITGPLELGTRRNIENRRWFIDVVCDRRGEAQDIVEKMQSLLNGNAEMYDFNLGHINPPWLGRMYFRNFKVFDIPDSDDRGWHHYVISVDAETLLSGA